MADIDQARGGKSRTRKPREEDQEPESPDPIEIAMKAVVTGADGHGAARAVLEKHAALIDVQCRREREEIANVRVQRITRWLILSAVAALLIGLAVLIRGAVGSQALVVEPFRVPPSLTQAGLSGEVMASQVMDQIALMQSRTLSTRPASTFSTDWGDDIKLSIPNTGATLGDLRRLLRSWFGKETRISGEVIRADAGWTVTARVSGNTAVSATDPALEKAVSKVAESVFQQTQPYRYVVFLNANGRNPEAIAAARQLMLNGPKEERPWGYVAYANSLDYPAFGAVESLAAARRSAEAVPDFPMPAGNYAGVLENLGRHEEALRWYRQARAILGNGRMVSDEFRDQYVAKGTAEADLITGAYADAARQLEAAGRVGTPVFATDYIIDAAFARYAIGDASAGDTDFARLLEISGFNLAGGQTPTGMAQNMPAVLVALRSAATIARADGLGDRTLLARDLPGTTAKLEAFFGTLGPAQSRDFARINYASVAPVLARIGEVEHAERLLRPLPLDCYPCVVARGDVAAAKGDRAAADRWFALAKRIGPSMPFADEARGRMLLAAGDLAGAQQAFQAASRIEPRFAAASMGLGQALATSGDWKGAAARFRDAARNAPRWGKLHMRLAEALWRTGRRDDALNTLSAVARMDLSPSDRALLERMRAKARARI